MLSAGICRQSRPNDDIGRRRVKTRTLRSGRNAFARIHAEVFRPQTHFRGSVQQHFISASLQLVASNQHGIASRTRDDVAAN